MKEITKFDKIILVLGFLIVIALFTLAYVVAFKGGQCVADPIAYIYSNNITIPYNYQNISP